MYLYIQSKWMRKMTTDISRTIAGECLAVRLRRLNRVVTGIYDKALRPLGLKVSQMNILVVVDRLGLARPAEVSRLLELDASTLSRNVERMRAKGWLEIVEDDDARAHPFQLTAKGARLLRRAFPAWERAQREAAGVLGEDGVRWLTDLGEKAGLSP
jgi:DNA-binding MarR family transcriptional regulator